MESSADGASRLADVIAEAWIAYEGLVTLGEEVEDEWSYVNDLAEAWRARVVEVEEGRGREPADAPVSAAIEALVAEANRIDDPHRAIDWLSTFPQVLLLAMGERP